MAWRATRSSSPPPQPASPPSISSPTPPQVLEDELGGKENQNKFILACDQEDDQTVSVAEMTKAFPPGAELVEQVRGR